MPRSVINRFKPRLMLANNIQYRPTCLSVRFNLKKDSFGYDFSRFPYGVIIIPDTNLGVIFPPPPPSDGIFVHPRVTAKVNLTKKK